MDMHLESQKVLHFPRLLGTFKQSCNVFSQQEETGQFALEVILEDQSTNTNGIAQLRREWARSTLNCTSTIAQLEEEMTVMLEYLAILLVEELDIQSGDMDDWLTMCLELRKRVVLDTCLKLQRSWHLGQGAKVTCSTITSTQYCPTNDTHNAYHGFEDFAERLLTIKAVYDPNNTFPIACTVY
jgi:hypothetical protein